MMEGGKKKKASSKQIQFLCQFKADTVSLPVCLGWALEAAGMALAVIPEVEVGEKALGVTVSTG